MPKAAETARAAGDGLCVGDLLAEVVDRQQGQVDPQVPFPLGDEVLLDLCRTRAS